MCPVRILPETTVNRIAKWNGTVWSSLGTGMGGPASPSPDVYALAEMPNGDLIAGGGLRRECTILYRSNAQSRVFEEALIQGWFSRFFNSFSPW